MTDSQTPGTTPESATSAPPAAPLAPAAAPPPYVGDPTGQQTAYVPAPPKSNGIAIAALILGIVALVMSFIPFVNYVSGVIALVGLILGIVGLVQKRTSTPLSIAGGTISLLALVLSIILAIVYTVAFSNAVSDSISKPITSAGSSAASPDDSSSSAAADSNFTFGETVTYKDGLAITVNAPEAFTPSEYAAGADQASNVVFTITVVNGTAKNYDPLLYATVSSAGTEASQIIDIEKKIDLGPTTTIPAGQSVTYQEAFSVADPSQLVMEISTGFDRDNAVFTS